MLALHLATMNAVTENNLTCISGEYIFKKNKPQVHIHLCVNNYSFYVMIKQNIYEMTMDWTLLCFFKMYSFHHGVTGKKLNIS